MTDSKFTYDRGAAIQVGSHGDHSLVFEEGEPVLDSGQSQLVFEIGVGISDSAFEGDLVLLTENNIIWATEDGTTTDKSQAKTFSAGEYRLTVEGEGWTHNTPNSYDTKVYYCDRSSVQSEDDEWNWWHAPCSRVEPTSRDFDETYILVINDEYYMGPAIVYPGAPYYNSGKDEYMNPQTFVFDDKNFGDQSDGTITLDSDGPIGIYNMDLGGAYSDNKANMSYGLTGPID